MTVSSSPLSSHMISLLSQLLITFWVKGWAKFPSDFNRVIQLSAGV